MKRWWSFCSKRSADRIAITRSAPSVRRSSCCRCPWSSRWPWSRCSPSSTCSMSSRVSADAVATVGVTESMLTIVYTVAIGPRHRRDGGGGAAHRREGRRRRGAGRGAVDRARADRRARDRRVFGYFNAERLLRLMGATPSMIESSLGYTKVMFARQRHGHAAVPQQRDLPRRRRSGDRDAHAVDRERDQHRACARCSSSASVRFPRWA